MINGSDSSKIGLCITLPGKEPRNDQFLDVGGKIQNG